jgi:hypothetical protein
MGPMFRFEAFAGQADGASFFTGMQIGFWLRAYWRVTLKP